MIVFSQWEPEFLELIAMSVRKEDEREIEATTGMSVIDSLRGIVDLCPDAQVGLLVTKEGVWELLGMYGIQDHGDQIGSPWMIGTDAIEEAGFEFARRSREQVDAWKRRFKLMWNWVHAENETAVEWLESLGFEVCDVAEPYGAKGELFRFFEWRTL